MRFTQLDRIIELNKGESIKATRSLALSEQYLEDHFPRFPVMPGVLMLEAAYQASMWLVRISDEFRYSTIVMEQAKSIKFQGFVQPGDTLTVNCTIKSRKESLTNLKVQGTINGELALAGRLTLDSYNLFDRNLVQDPYLDELCTSEFRDEFRSLCNQLDPNNPLKLALASS